MAFWNSWNKHRIGVRRLLTFLSQMRRLFEGGAYSSKYGSPLSLSSVVVSIPKFGLVRMKCGSGMMGLVESYLKDPTSPCTRRRLVSTIWSPFL